MLLNIMTFHIRDCFRARRLLRNYESILKLIKSKRHYCSVVPKITELERKNELFSIEQKRQYESVGRIEKITVNIAGPPEDTALIMNKDISTPYDCARHLSERPTNSGVLALLEPDTLWDMHRPLTSDCNLRFLYFDDFDPRPLNNVFWESCSIILGCVISSVFKDNVKVLLHSYPTPDYKTGSFVYDAQLSLRHWEVTPDELRVIAAEMIKFCSEGHKFERLTVGRELALKIMEGNPFKEEQVEAIASKRSDKVTLYRVGNHIDISEGPLMSSTSLLSRCSITAVHQLKSDIDLLYRFQGVALPKPLMLNHSGYGILENRARKLNPGCIPTKQVSS